MKNNLPYIAVGLYIVITLLLILMPKRWLLKIAKKDFGANERSWKRKDNIGYYRIMFLLGGLVTIAIMIILEYILH